MDPEEAEYISDDETIHDLDVLASSSPEPVSFLPQDMGNLALAAHANSRGEDDVTGDDNSFNDILPAVHAYLGEDFEEISGRNIYTELRVVTIPILSGSFGTLLPGQTFPLNVRDRSRTEMLRKCVEGDHTFGCIATRVTGETNESIYGTTAEIYEYSDVMGVVCIKARGRQRFKLVSCRRTANRYKIAQVLILPEVKLLHPFTSLHYSSLNGLRVTNKEKCRKIEANLLPWPKWAYDMYDPEKLVARADQLTFLKRGIREVKGQSTVMPKDPTELSFWIAGHLDAEQRLFMLSLDSPIPRLRWLLSFLNKNHQFNCRGCEVFIGRQGDTFAMSIEGAQGTYVNAEGYHHDTFTLLRAINIVPISSPSTHFSWFPGYAWSIAVCLQCQKHLGWQFIATRQNLSPQRFWGLTRQSLDTRIVSDGHNPADIPVM